MNQVATRWAWERRCSQPSHRLVLLALASKADRNHVCRQSTEDIIRATLIPAQGLELILRELQASGAILQIGDAYQLNVPTRPRGPAPGKGTRLPDDWVLPDEWRAWAKEYAPDMDVDHEAEVFRDYWLARSDRGAVKRNWYATWRNWIRRAAPKKKEPKPWEE